MAYKQNNPFSRKASSPFNQNGEELDLTQVRGKKFYTRPIGDDERYDTENVTHKKLDERTGEVLVGNKPGGRGNRVDYLPAKETLRHGYDDQYQVSDKIYNKARAMMRDSLSLVNKGKGVTAASVYGPNLGQDLRKSTSSGNFESKISKNLWGMDDEKNIASARAMKYRGGTGHGYDMRTGEHHVDFGGGTVIPSSKELKSYRRRKGFIN
jgi:hypothetical protein